MNKMIQRVKTSNKFSVILLVLAFTFVLALSLNLIHAASDIDVKINARMDTFDTDFYMQTNNDSITGFDFLDFEVRNFPSGNYSFLFSDISSKNLTIDSWPSNATSRILYLIYRVNPLSSGSLNLTWNKTGFTGYSASLTDYGSNSTFSNGGNASSEIDMTSEGNYTVILSGSIRYFLIELGKLVYCGNNVCDSSSGENCANCADCACGTGQTCSSGVCVTSETGDDGTGTSCTDTCSSKGYECGTHTICSISKDCGSCPSGEDCNNQGKCIAVNVTNITCSNECSLNGLTQCSNSIAYRTCGNYDVDNCLEWSQVTDCDTGEICDSGSCISSSCNVNSDCNDNNACTDDNCNILTHQCVINYNLNSCNDNNLCTFNDKCSFGSCSGTQKSCSLGYSCNPSTGNCEEGNPPEVIPDNLQRIGPDGCGYNFICGDWSSCDVRYDVNNLISSLDSSGMKSRTCTDTKECMASFIENQVCSLKEEISVSSNLWCGEEYTEITSKITGKVIARIKQISEGKSVSVDLNAVGNGYCPYCFDGIKNYDETDVDCGGSCMDCRLIEKQALKRFWQKAWFGLLLSLIIFLIFLGLTIWLSRENYRYFRENYYLMRLLRKYHYWKNKGYDVNVLDRDAAALKESSKK